MTLIKSLAVACVAGVMSVYALAGHAAVTDKEFISDTAVPSPEYGVALKGHDDRIIGNALITKAPKGVFVMVDVFEMPEGWHSIHFHAVGDCSDHADHFKKSGGHVTAEGQEHGFFSAKGPHSGDLPNFYVGSDKRAKFHVYSTDITVEQLMDADGSALVVHEKADDYASQPAGNAGDRLACGPVTAIQASR